MHHIQPPRPNSSSLSCVELGVVSSVNLRLVLWTAHEHSDYRGQRQSSAAHVRIIARVMVSHGWGHNNFLILVLGSFFSVYTWQGGERYLSLLCVVYMEGSCGRDNAVLSGGDCLYNCWIECIWPHQCEACSCVLWDVSRKNLSRA